MGIAIPVFLNQRKGAQDAAAKSNVREAASAEQAYRTQNNAYAGTADALQPFGFNQGTPEVTVTGGSNNFCVAATSQSDAEFHMTQDTGEPQDGACS